MPTTVIGRVRGWLAARLWAPGSTMVDLELIHLELRKLRLEVGVLSARLERQSEAAITLAREVRRMSAELEKLKTEVAKLTTVSQGATTLLRQLAQMIRDRAGDRDALLALADEVTASAKSLADAVEESTPAAPPPA